jgi:serine/threonine-protein kinase
VDVPEERSSARPRTDSDASLRGRQLGDFVLRECIGAGAFAAVYRCDQPLLGREAVVKVLHQRMRESEVMLQRFMREARLASRLDHPYAAHVYAFGVEPNDGLAWIAMELVHGTSLERWLVERGPLPLDVLVGLIEQVSEIVQNAHDHGIVHRDLKPSNVMLIEYAGKIFPKLLDFGIAKLIDETAQGGMLASPVDVGDELLSAPMESGNLHLTQANATLGSPPYMSPEQWCDPLSVGPRSDLYSLGVMTYEALTGRQPFTGDTIAAIGEQHCNAEVPPVGSSFPAALDRVFQRALAKTPEARPVSAIAFARELRIAALPRAADPQAAITTAAMVPLPRRRAWPLAAGAAALVAGGIAVYAFAVSDRDGAAASLASRSAEPPTEPPPSRIPVGAPAGAAPVLAAPAATATVQVEIDSLPYGAEVYRIPSETRVGYTPWKAELPRDTGTQVFLVRKLGFGDRRVEVDLRTGGAVSVKLPRMARKPTAQPASPAAAPMPTRRAGEPVDPFRSGGT